MRPLAPFVLLAALGLTATAAVADSPRSAVISDPEIGKDCPRADGTTHTTDVVVHGRTVAATWAFGEEAGIGLATSQDGGRSWDHEAAPFTVCTGGELDFVVNPHLGIGADGAPWLSASGPLPLEGPAGATTGDAEGRVLVSVDGQEAVSVFPGLITERGFLATDPADADTGWVLGESLTRTFLYAGGFGSGAFVPSGPQDGLVLARTDDRGRTWERSTLRTPSPGSQVIALGLAHTRGALVALSVEVDLKDPQVVAGTATTVLASARGSIASQTSTDGGRTWSAPVVVGLVDQSTLLSLDAADGMLAVASAQTDGTLLVFTSADAGRSWTRATAATGVAQPTTGIAVDRRGRVTVLSYALDGDTWTPQLSTSRDRGRTWSAPVALGSGFVPEKRFPLPLPLPPGTPLAREGAASGSHVPPAGPYNGADTDGRDVLVGFVADDDGDGLVEARLARVRGR